jgi:hypothetical protein
MGGKHKNVKEKRRKRKNNGETHVKKGNGCKRGKHKTQ